MIPVNYIEFVEFGPGRSKPESELANVHVQMIRTLRSAETKIASLASLYESFHETENHPWDLRGKSKEQWTKYLGKSSVCGYFVVRDSEKAFCALTIGVNRGSAYWSQRVNKRSDNCFELEGSNLHFDTLQALVQAYKDPATCANQRQPDIPYALQDDGKALSHCWKEYISRVEDFRKKASSASIGDTTIGLEDVSGDVGAELRAEFTIGGETKTVTAVSGNVVAFAPCLERNHSSGTKVTFVTRMVASKTTSQEVKWIGSSDTLFTIGSQAAVNVQSCRAKTISHIQQLVSNEGVHSVDAALSEQLSPVKDILSVGFQMELQFASANLYSSCDFRAYEDMFLAPIIEVIIKRLADLKNRVFDDPDRYREVLSSLKTEDKVMYDATFRKSINEKLAHGDPGGYAKMLEHCATLQAECDFAVAIVDRQPTKYLISLVLMTRERIPAYKDMITQLLEEAKGVCSSDTAVVHAIYRPNDAPKSPYRMFEKALTKGPDSDYPDCSKIFDVFGCIINCSDYTMMTAVVATFTRQHKSGMIRIVRLKDRWTVPSEGGWRDLMLNVVIDDVVFEVQVVLQDMLKVRGTLDGHVAYNQFRCFSEVFALLKLPTDRVIDDRDPLLDYTGETICISANLPPLPVVKGTKRKQRLGKTPKFEAPAIQLGDAVAAATGLAHLMGIDEATIGAFLVNPMNAIEAEFQNGNAEDKKNFTTVMDGSYRNPPDAEGNYDTTPPQTIDALMQSPEVLTAGLGRHHVVALRLYTTTSYASINAPLRKDPPTKPNPFAATTYFISDAIKKMRANAAKRPDAFTPVVYWRGLKGMALPKKFAEEGGTEFGCMSTSASKDVAMEFSESQHPLVFKFATDNFMSRGADISFLSAYPEEKETLYPPLTYLHVVKLSVEVINNIRVLVASVKPTF